MSNYCCCLVADVMSMALVMKSFLVMQPMAAMSGMDGICTKLLQGGNFWLSLNCIEKILTNSFLPLGGKFGVRIH